jgi:hypothetical protein
MTLHLIIDGDDHPAKNMRSFDALMTEVYHRDDLELWMSHDDQSSLCALLNAQRGWMMFLRFQGDPGLVSRNPDIDDSEAAFETFNLGNGQTDSYPKSWTFDRATVFSALSEFAQTGKMPSCVAWIDHNPG